MLQSERVDRQGRQIRRRAALETLPDGSFVALEPAAETAYLKHGDALFPWSLDGYGAPIRWPAGRPVLLLTPPSLIAVIERGYQAALHASGPVAASPKD